MSGVPGGSTAAAVRATPPDFRIAIAPGTGQAKSRMALGGRRPRSSGAPVEPVERLHPMRGYEEGFADVVDWVVGITERIWEDQDVGHVYDTYAPGVRLHDDAGWRYGVEGVVEGTLASIDAFADVRSYADDVIWAGDEDAGFVTSHRALNTGHHTGAWRWGPATGRPLSLWVIANCVSRENLIHEEWVLHNAAGRLAQLGYDVAACARAHAAAGGVAALGERQRGEVERLAGGRRPEPYRAEDHPGRPDVEHVLRGLFHDVWTRRDLSAVDRAHAPDVRWHGASGREGYGRSDVRAMARALLATFPDLGLHVDEVFWMGDDADGYSASVRWSAAGTHRGHALYGAPTGRRAFLWGISQLYLRGGRVVEEWALFNEFDVMAQVLDPAPLP